VTEPLGGDLSMLGVGGRQRDEELVTSPAPIDVVSAQRVSHAIGDRTEDLIAGFVAIAVVGLLEAVEVDHQHRQGLATAAGVSGAASEVFVQCAPVE